MSEWVTEALAGVDEEVARRLTKSPPRAMEFARILRGSITWIATAKVESDVQTTYLSKADVAAAAARGSVVAQRRRVGRVVAEVLQALAEPAFEPDAMAFDGVVISYYSQPIAHLVNATTVSQPGTTMRIELCELKRHIASNVQRCADLASGELFREQLLEASRPRYGHAAAYGAFIVGVTTVIIWLCERR
jgi:hypothetical protein